MITFTSLGKLGRLGNQMFQIASTIGISRRIGTGYCFPEWEYQDFFTKKLQEMVIVPQMHGDEGKSDYRDLRGIMDPSINVNLYGYFQSHLYFNHCEEEALSYFELKPELINYILDKYPDIKNKTSVHVRRGDYLVLQEYHPVQTIEYYKQAIEHVGNSHEFYIFSDDIEWCKENFKDYNCTFIEERPHDKEETVTVNENLREANSRKFLKEDVIELFMTSLCKNNIIANSSFSCWGAYLNKNKDKKVVAPSRWFTEARVAQSYHDKDNHLKHRIPESWKII